MKSFLGFLPVIVFFFACSNQSQNSNNSQAEINSLKNEFGKYRQEKDNNFKTADWSPLTPEDKLAFNGLPYFEYNVSYRYQLRIHTYTNMDTIEVPGSKSGDLRKAVPFGYFEFKREGQNQRLEVWKMMPRTKEGESHLFVGFWDATSDKSTYAGGRYLDITEVRPDVYLSLIHI